MDEPMLQKANTDREAPKRLIPSNDRDEDKRENDRNENVEPIFAKPSTDSWLPKRNAPHTENFVQ